MDQNEHGEAIDPDTMRRIDEQRDRWAKRISENVNLGNNIATSLDKTLVSLSGGALVFSMTFIDRIASQKLWLWLLISAWTSFVGCISCVVCANRAVLLSLSRGADGLATLAEKFEEEVRAGRIRSVIPSVNRTKSVAIWNEAAIAAFILGIILLGIFIVRNFWPPAGLNS